MISNSGSTLTYNFAARLNLGFLSPSQFLFDLKSDDRKMNRPKFAAKVYKEHGIPI